MFLVPCRIYIVYIFFGGPSDVATGGPFHFQFTLSFACVFYAHPFGGGSLLSHYADNGDKRENGRP